MIQKNPPCKNCTRRSSTCHIEGNCDAYTEWNKAHKVILQEQRRAKEPAVAIQSFEIHCRDVALRAIRHHY